MSTNRSSSWSSWSPAPLRPAATGARRPGGPAAARRHAGASASAPRLGSEAIRSPEPRRLAGEHDPAAGPQHPVKLGEGAAQVGQVVQDGVAEHEVEALVGERQRLGVGARGPAPGGPGAARCAASVATMPGEMSVQVASPTTPACSRFRLK